MANFDKNALEILKSSTGGVELTGAELHSLEWLAGWETSTAANLASIIRKAREGERKHTPGLTRNDLLTIWGYLQALKDIYEGKARNAAKRGDEIGANLTADYMKWAAEITTMQTKINNEAEAVQ